MYHKKSKSVSCHTICATVANIKSRQTIHLYYLLSCVLRRWIYYGERINMRLYVPTGVSNRRCMLERKMGGNLQNMRKHKTASITPERLIFLV